MAKRGKLATATATYRRIAKRGSPLRVSCDSLFASVSALVALHGEPGPTLRREHTHTHIRTHVHTYRTRVLLLASLLNHHSHSLPRRPLIIRCSSLVTGMCTIAKSQRSMYTLMDGTAIKQCLSVVRTKEHMLRTREEKGSADARDIVSGAWLHTRTPRRTRSRTRGVRAPS
jgi:hypothetical protein